MAVALSVRKMGVFLVSPFLDFANTRQLDFQSKYAFGLSPESPLAKSVTIQILKALRAKIFW